MFWSDWIRYYSDIFGIYSENQNFIQKPIPKSQFWPLKRSIKFDQKSIFSSKIILYRISIKIHGRLVVKNQNLNQKPGEKEISKFQKRTLLPEETKERNLSVLWEFSVENKKVSLLPSKPLERKTEPINHLFHGTRPWFTSFTLIGVHTQTTQD